MKYELGYLESLIGSDNFLHPKDESSAATVAALVEAEATRLRIALKDGVFALDTEERIERYIHDSQQVLLYLMNAIPDRMGSDSEYVYSDRALPWISDLYRNTYIHLDGLLSYLEQYFGAYFNQALPVPPGYVSATLRDIQEAYRYILSVLHRASISEALLAVLADPVDSFINHTRQDSRTYHTVRYMRRFVAELMRVCSDIEEGALEDVLIERLFYFNLNTPLLYHFHVTRITAEVKVLDAHYTARQR